LILASVIWAAEDIAALRLQAERYFTTISIQYSPLPALEARLFGAARVLIRKAHGGRLSRIRSFGR
jgi:hypothetical protein